MKFLGHRMRKKGVEKFDSIGMIKENKDRRKIHNLPWKLE